jgi:hypothetical protein
MEDKMKLWNALAKPPESSLKKIQAGRLKGMTDIKPQWRYKAMTEYFGPCGEGWKYDIVEMKTFDGSDGQVVAIVTINLFYAKGITSHGTVWSDPVPGIGGSMLIANERNGPHTSDEAFKMALTDALSYAMSKIGVAAEIYMGNWNGSKYKDDEPAKTSAKREEKSMTRGEFGKAVTVIKAAIGDDKYHEICTSYKVNQASELSTDKWQEFLSDMGKVHDKIKQSQSMRND